MLNLIFLAWRTHTTRYVSLCALVLFNTTESSPIPRLKDLGMGLGMNHILTLMIVAAQFNDTSTSSWQAKAMTCNILVSRPLFGTTAMRAGGYYY